MLPGCLSELEAEFSLWKSRWASDTVALENAFDAYEQCPMYYPNIKLLLKVLCTLPVTSASAERTFSMLRRLKTWLRSTMSDDRFTGLALLASCTHTILTTEAVVDSSLTKRRNILKTPYTHKV